MTTGGAYAEEVLQKVRQSAESSSLSQADAHESLLREADALIKGGKPDEAYLLLEPLEFERAGEVRFDYLISIAALDSGRPDKATLALERVLAVNPDHSSARLDIARAYFQLRDFPRAQTEFFILLKQNPSGAVRKNIQKYMDEIDTQGKRTRFSGYVEVGGGHDSNANNAVSQSQVYVDLPATMATLDAASVEKSDSYYGAAIGGELSYSLNSHWALHLVGDLRKRGNRTYSEFDSVNKDMRAGVTYEKKSNRVRLNVVASQYDVGGAPNSDMAGIKAELRHEFSPSNQLNAVVQSMQYRYVDPLLKPNDINQNMVGLGWSHVLSDGDTSLFGSVHYGTEKDVSPIISVSFPGIVGMVIINPSGGRNDGAKRFSGLRVGGQAAPSEKTVLFASAGIQTGNYDKVNYLFLRQRKDDLYDLKLGVDWHWAKSWTLRSQLSYSKNDSNIVINSFSRTDVSLNIRRNFR